LVDTIYSADRVFIAGVGRSGLVGKLFAMRLMHIGKEVYIVGEVNTPRIERGDLLIAITGSGSTSTIIHNAKIAKSAGANVLVLTAKSGSMVERYSDKLLIFNMKSKYETKKLDESIFPLGSAFEWSALLTLETSIANLIEKTFMGEKF